MSLFLLSTHGETNMFEIDFNVPIPSPKAVVTKYPFAIMKIGDSFFVPNKTASEVSPHFARARRRLPGTKFACRTVVENGVKGVRVWRVK